jgi:hypothetical protein
MIWRDGPEFAVHFFIIARQAGEEPALQMTSNAKWRQSDFVDRLSMPRDLNGRVAIGQAVKLRRRS